MARPLKFQTCEELQTLIDGYFKDVETPKAVGDTIYFEPATITGLALAIGTSRELLNNYESREEFRDTIKEAKLKVEHYAEKMLYMGKSATGPIFALKNFGWKDTHDTNITADIGIRGILNEVSGTSSDL